MGGKVGGKRSREAKKAFKHLLSMQKKQINL